MLTEEEIEKVKNYLTDDVRKNERVSVIIEMAWRRARGIKCLLGDDFYYGLSLVAMHMATLEDRGDGSSGQVMSKTEGQISISYANGASDDNPYFSSTAYGQSFLSLLKERRPFPGITGRSFRGC